MKHLTTILFLYSLSIFAQEPIETVFIKETKMNSDQLIAIDNFQTSFFINDKTFYKESKTKNLSYTNLQLGSIYSANAFNQLKINLFYKDFNTVIILDNRLAEIFKIDFNNIQPYKNISKISTGHDNTIWIFNQDNQKLELYDYKNNITRARTLPIQSEIIDLKSNYNYCFLLTKDFLYTYNYFGSLVSKIKNSGYTAIAENNENIILKKENSLFYLKKDAEKPRPITTPDFLIKRFFVMGESLYIYNNESLQQFLLKT